MRLYRKLRGFIKDARSELKKVVWPTMDEVKGYTNLVLIVLVAVAAWIGLLEFVCHRVTDAVHLYGV